MSSNIVAWFQFFFFKQKTAYEMRIMDWSSDVCSSDLKDSFRVSLRLRPIEALENYTIYENTDIDENGNAQIFSDFTSTHPLAGQMAMLLNQQQARGVRKLATSTPLFFRFKSKGVINTTTLNITNNISLKNKIGRTHV